VEAWSIIAALATGVQAAAPIVLHRSSITWMLIVAVDLARISG
jgi:hypothetical protein